jgi:hypothetical protein
MIENYEFRLYTRYATRLGVVDNSASEHLVTISVKGEVGDDLYRRIEMLEAELAASTSDRAFAGWNITRSYTDDEIEEAELLLVKMRYAHLAGDEYGTQYVMSAVDHPCNIEFQTSELKSAASLARAHSALRFVCGVSSQQVGPLILPSRKILKSHDLFLLWSGETIALNRVAPVIKGASGCRLQAIAEPINLRQSKKGGESSASGRIVSAAKSRDGRSEIDTHKAKQLIVESKPLAVDPQTSFGDNPFRTKTSEHCSCPFGEVRGSRLVSELSVSRSTWDGADVCATEVHVGSWRGLFRPRRLLVISKGLYQSLRSQQVRGVEFEIVHITE